MFRGKVPAIKPSIRHSSSILSLGYPMIPHHNKKSIDQKRKEKERSFCELLLSEMVGSKLKII
uniref:Uncharacterized protein n=1 Tax=Onchocerca volvulus TaxID=6282 RepID=A0A8R1TWS9_ONCVO